VCCQGGAAAPPPAVQTVGNKAGPQCAGDRCALSGVCPELQVLVSSSPRKCGAAQDPHSSEFACYLWLCAASWYPNSRLCPSNPSLLMWPTQCCHLSLKPLSNCALLGSRLLPSARGHL
jgi:hypothetical protein